MIDSSSPSSKDTYNAHREISKSDVDGTHACTKKYRGNFLINMDSACRHNRSASGSFRVRGDFEIFKKRLDIYTLVAFRASISVGGGINALLIRENSV